MHTKECYLAFTPDECQARHVGPKKDARRALSKEETPLEEEILKRLNASIGQKLKRQLNGQHKRGTYQAKTEIRLPSLLFKKYILDPVIRTRRTSLRSKPSAFQGIFRLTIASTRDFCDVFGLDSGVKVNVYKDRYFVGTICTLKEPNNMKVHLEHLARLGMSTSFSTGRLLRSERFKRTVESGSGARVVILESFADLSLVFKPALTNRERGTFSTMLYGENVYGQVGYVRNCLLEIVNPITLRYESCIQKLTITAPKHVLNAEGRMLSNLKK